MLRKMSAREWIDWQVYMTLAPIVEERMDIRFAQIVAAIANVMRNEKTHPVPFEVSDFVLRFGDTPEMLGPAPKPASDPEQFGSVMRAIAEAYGKKKEPS